VDLFGFEESKKQERLGESVLFFTCKAPNACCNKHGSNYIKFFFLVVTKVVIFSF